MGLGVRVPAPTPVPPSDLPALVVGGAARGLGGEGRGGGTVIFPVWRGNLEAPPPTPTPGTGPGKFAREKKNWGKWRRQFPGEEPGWRGV